jgi:hypothetical protein
MTRKRGLKPFTTDGCSGFMSFAWRLFLRKPPPWEGCCIEHDRAYWRGGEKSLRRQVDLKLKQCVADQGHPYWAMLIYFGVRVGGFSWLPFPSIRINQDGSWHFSLTEVRWGYGWPYPHYREESPMPKVQCPRS